MPPLEDHCWLSDNDHQTVLLAEDTFKKPRWEDTLRPLSPGETRRNSKREHSVERQPRPFDASPGRKFSSTVAWRNKMKDEIPYQPAEKRIRPVSCPPTPRPRPKPEPEAVNKSPRPKSTVRVRIKAPEKEKPKPVPLPSRRPIDFPKIPRDPSTPKPFKCEGNCPVPVRKMSVSSSQSKSPMPPSEHHLRIDYDLKDSGSGSGSGGSSGGSGRSRRRSVKKTRSESLSGSYSSSNTVVHHYDGCQIM